jgi:hypothetical protein
VFGYFCCNFDKSSGVIISPIQNKSKILGNIGELSWVIVLPTKMGYNDWFGFGHLEVAAVILVN